MNADDEARLREIEAAARKFPAEFFCRESRPVPGGPPEVAEIRAGDTVWLCERLRGAERKLAETRTHLDPIFRLADMKGHPLGPTFPVLDEVDAAIPGLRALFSGESK